MVNRQSKIRRAFIWRPGMCRRDSITPPAEVEPAVCAIVERWNERIPRNRVRVLDAARFREAANTLAVLALDEVLEAIDFYAAQKWQRVQGAWKTFDHFIQLDCVRGWWEQSAEAAERAEANADRRRAAGAARADADDDWQAEQDRMAAERVAFDALPEVERDRLLREAHAELASLGVQPGRITPFGLRMQAIVIMKRDGPLTADGTSASGGAGRQESNAS